VITAFTHYSMLSLVTVSLQLDAVNPATVPFLEAFSEALCFEFRKCSLLFLNCDDYIKYPSVQ
jgi:hypothetical protein